MKVCTSLHFSWQKKCNMEKRNFWLGNVMSGLFPIHPSICWSIGWSVMLSSKRPQKIVKLGWKKSQTSLEDASLTARSCFFSSFSSFYFSFLLFSLPFTFSPFLSWPWMCPTPFCIRRPGSPSKYIHVWESVCWSVHPSVGLSVSPSVSQSISWSIRNTFLKNNKNRPFSTN